MSDNGETRANPYESPITEDALESDVLEHLPVAPVGERLWNRSFVGLVIAQFLGATNDNIFRYLVVGIGKEIVGPNLEARAIAVGMACLVLPFILFASFAGWLSDRFSKRTVVVGCKLLEVIAMSLGAIGIYTNNVYLLFVILFLMGTQSALFGPAKYGCLPEMFPTHKLSAANACLGMTTVIAIVLGTIIGNSLFEATKSVADQRWWIGGCVIVGVAAVGWAFSLLMRPLPAAAPNKPFQWNFVAETMRDLRTMRKSMGLFRVALGSAYFWTLASLTNLTVDPFVTRFMNLEQPYVGYLLGVLAIGVAVGNVAAGVLSRGRVELGLVPIAALGLALSTTALAFSSTLEVSYLWMFFIGTAAGMFDVPLQSYLQQNSPNAERGSILAAANFLTFGGMLIASLLFEVVRMPRGVDLTPLMSPQGIFIGEGLTTLVMSVYAFSLLPHQTLRFLFFLVLSVICRVKIINPQHVPNDRGAVLTPNHVSWLDGMMMVILAPRPVRTVLYADFYENRWMNWLFKVGGAIPIRPGSKRSVIEAIRTAREALKKGELLCVFPEGAFSRTGQLFAFETGVLGFIRDTKAPIVPVYLGGLSQSIFGFVGLPRWRELWYRWPIRAQLVYGKPLEQVTTIDPVRQAVLDLGPEAMAAIKHQHLTLPRLFIRMCRRNLRRTKVVDTTGVRLTGATLLLRTLIVRRLLLKHVLQAGEQNVGVLLPPSAGAVLANAALSLCWRTSVNLNYTVSEAVMNLCIRDAGIKHVLTSRQVMRKLDMKLDAEVVYIEDFRDKVTKADKAIAAAQAFATPAFMLDRILGLQRISPDDVVTIIFTSGSTGEPKGVMLTYENVGSNVQAIEDLVKLTARDTLMGILPFFHSLGYTVTCWTILTLDLKGAYHFSPLEAQKIGELAKQEQATIMLCTPTFLRSYLKRISPEEFKTLEVVVGGAEKLPVDLCEAFEQKFGVRPVEGYGTTECSPLVSVNIPASRIVQNEFKVVVSKEGTVGRPIPGVSARVVDPDTGATLPVGESGMLHIKGPNIMKGYLNKQEKTAEVLRDGWYTTGDIALIDSDGFIKITGRQSRFSKIGGEMVPHIRIEESLQKIIGGGEDEVRVAVTAVADARKGERLVVVHLAMDKSPSEICKQLGEEGLPNLWIPSADSFVEVAAIPHLGTGKLDLKGLKDLANDRFAEKSA